MFSRVLLLLVSASVSGCLQNHELFQDVAENTPDAGAAPEKRAAGEPCTRDDDCLTATVCNEQVCTPCPPSTSCRENFSALQRNGCTWCTPLNDCLSDAECGTDIVCYPGLQCTPGCTDDPRRCCFGNLCSDPSCGPPPNLDCSRVGCADGSRCVGAGRVNDCACDPTTHQWQCTMQDGENECEHFSGGGPQGGGRM